MSMFEASKVLNINPRFTTVRIIGGNDIDKTIPRIRTDLDVSGGCIIRKTLCVNGNIDVGCSVIITKDLDVVGNTTLQTELEVCGNATFKMDLCVVGNLKTGNLCVEKIKANLQGNLCAATTFVIGNLVIEKDLDVEGNVSVMGTTISSKFIGPLQGDLCADTTVEGNLTVEGDLTVMGNTTTIQSETHVITDNKIVVNDGELGAGVTLGTAGIEIDRGSLPDYLICFEEARGCTVTGEIGSTKCVANREDVPVGNGIARWNEILECFVTTKNLTFDPVSGNLDIGCQNISNVQALFVDQMFGKNSPINVEDELNITSSGTKITFEDGIEIGNALTSASGGTNAIAIGKCTKGLGTGAVAIGYKTVTGTGDNSIGIGVEAMGGGLATGTDNIAIGNVAAFALTSGNRNIAIGSRSLRTNRQGYDNIAIGYRAMENMDGSGTKHGSRTIAIGSNVLRSETGGSYGYDNVLMGFRAVELHNYDSEEAMNYNVIIGANALRTFTGTSYNLIKSVFIGANVGENCTSGGNYEASYCVAIGFRAFGGSSGTPGIGRYNVAIGYKSMFASSAAAQHSVAIGAYSLNAVIGGANNVAIGYGADVDVGGAIERIAIGHNAVVTGDAYVQLGEKVKYSGANAQMYFRSQRIATEEWCDGEVELAFIDKNGNLQKGNLITPGASDITDLLVNGNLDLQCANIINVNALHFGNMFGKSPILVHDQLVIKDTAAGGKIRFEAGVEIGDVATNASESTSIAIGKYANCVASGSIAIGSGASQSDSANIADTAATNTVAIGTKINNVRDRCVAIGYSLDMSGSGVSNPGQASIAIGSLHHTYDNYGTYGGQRNITMGYNIFNHGVQNDNIFIGGTIFCANPGTYNCIAMGYNPKVYGGKQQVRSLDGIVMGQQSEIHGYDSIAIGAGSVSYDNGTSLGIDTYTDVGGVALGRKSSATGYAAIAIGGVPQPGATGNASRTEASGYASIAIGRTATTVVANAIAIGTLSTATSGDTVAIGLAADAGGAQSVAIGQTADASSTGSIAIGQHAEASTGTFAIAIGGGATPGAGADATATNTIAIGKGTTASAANAIVIGTTSSAMIAGAIAMGRNAVASTGTYAIAIGGGAPGGAADSTAADAIAVGRNTTASASCAIAVGLDSTASAANVIAIGCGSSSSTADAIVMGSLTPAGSPTASAWGQTFQDKSWDDGNLFVASINITGDIVKGGSPAGVVANISSTFATNAPSAADGAFTVADGDAPTGSELSEAINELTEKVNEIADALRSIGLLG